ncbi:PaaI family thioesterase [Algiphilus aromaticivorans]|uniref:PaaI family thioesterase n=1 Tax=Algiphilus aromaticivorans TaxID=382454 RepID=UPI0005C1490A|nr:PaaI family thioesterase [Algiphilus aromaticivorans]
MSDRLAAVRALQLHRDLGVTGIEAADGAATLCFTVNPYAVNPAGALHGGVLYTLCDVAAYSALLSQLPMDREAVTHDLHVSVMRAASEGEKVAIEAHVRRLGRSIAFIDVEARAGERLLATARVTKSLVNC